MDTKRRRRDPAGRSEHISVSFNKWWLLPSGILSVSALIALSIMVFGPSFIGPRVADCSGDRANDYSCYQKRYQDLVDNSGVETAFTDLKDEFTKEQFVKVACHQLTHVIGRAAADLYGDDVASTYSRGDDFCGSGYYHGAMETIVANIGADNILDEADDICADLREHQNQSLNHRNCTHGLGHGFMGMLDNELFESLEACDALTDGWEREQCYNGVFMENIPNGDDWSHPSKYLKEDQPLYPCTVVDARYKNQCYQKQTSYALKTQGVDFTKVFDLCGGVEADFRPACYQGLGRDALEYSLGRKDLTGVAQTESTNTLCMIGEDHEARSNCVIGAVRQLILGRRDEQAKAFCETPDDADLRAVCLQAAEKYYEDFALD